MDSQPYQVLCTYLVKPECVTEMQDLLSRHWGLLAEHQLVTHATPHVYFGEDESGPFFVEILTWSDSEAATRAYWQEEINALWTRFFEITEPRGSRPAIQYPRISDIAIHFPEPIS